MRGTGKQVIIGPILTRKERVPASLRVPGGSIQPEDGMEMDDAPLSMTTGPFL